MADQLDTEKLSHAIRSKRGAAGLRQAAEQIGDISFTTLSRLEQGHVPDVDTYIRVCKWLQMPTESFIVNNDIETEKSEKKIVALLRSDRTLPQAVAGALIQMITLAYKTEMQDNHTVLSKKRK